MYTAFYVLTRIYGYSTVSRRILLSRIPAWSPALLFIIKVHDE